MIIIINQIQFPIQINSGWHRNFKLANKSAAGGTTTAKSNTACNIPADTPSLPRNQ